MHIVRFIGPVTGEATIGLDDGVHIREIGGSIGELLRLTVTELRDRCAAADGPRHDRPELFFKSAAWRVTGHGQHVSVRGDSEIDVPEPELGLVVNRHGEIAGYTVVNDMSSRTIEGENPLYLPQAKIYLGGCATGPAIRPVWEVLDPYTLGIELTITRDGERVWNGQAGTGQLHRRLDDLVGYLFREDVFPDGVILATGTCLVPELPFTLRAGDEITISIGEVGTLTSTVVAGKAAMPGF